jgi:small subunit ribosomal protein S6
VPLYEHVFLARQDLRQAQCGRDRGKRHQDHRRQWRKVAKTETWGLRSSPIASPRTARRITCARPRRAAAAVAELERQSNINEDIIRFLTIRVDEHEKGPSAMMRRGDKERVIARRPRHRDSAREEEVE